MDMNGITFDEACGLPIGNYLIDTFRLWCGIPLWFTVVFVVLSLLLLIYVWTKKHNYRYLIFTAISLFIFWKIIRIFLVLLFFKTGLLVSSELTEMIIKAILSPIGFYIK